MQGGQFPASAANSLIQGYCEDFVSFAAVLAQTLEQVSMRGIDLKQSRTDLERIENGMRNLAEAIHDLLARQPAKGGAKPTERAAEKPAPNAAASPNATTPPKSPPAPANAMSGPSPATATKAPTPTTPSPTAATTPTNAVAKAAPAQSQGAVRVDMRPRDDAGGDGKSSAPKPTAASSTTTAPAAQAANAPAPRPSSPPANAATNAPANTNAAANPAAPAPATAPAAPANGGAPAAAGTSSPPANAPGRQVANAPAKRAKAAAPGSAPRQAAAAAAAAPRPGQRPTKRPENLKGTNRSMPLLSVMQFLGRMRKRGTMKVLLPGETLTFDIENGCVMSATSSACPRDERLGDILCDMDICCREQLEPLELLVESGQAAERFGQLVIEHQLATDQQVVAALEAQVRTRFSRACKHLEASYEFAEGERTSTPPAFPVQPLPIA